MTATSLVPEVATRLAVGELLARAAFALDEREDGMLADCFAADAVFTLRIAGGDLIGPFEGRDAIMGLMRGAWDEQTDVRRHVVSNVLYPSGQTSGDGGTLSVISYLTLMATADGRSELLTTGVYRDELVSAEGGWQILRRHLDLETSY